MANEDQVTRSSIKLRISKIACANCNNVFSSGKALGDHMIRKHFRNLETKTIRDSDNRIFRSSGGLWNCSICGKKFASVKALSGHMRLHPDRSWRGIAPEKNSSSSSMVNQTESLATSWSLTAKRGRRTTQSGHCSDTGSCPDESMEDQQMLEAVSDLMLLTRDCKLETRENRVEEIDQVRSPNFPSEESVIQEIRGLNVCDEESRKMKAIQLETIRSKRSYECSICGKKFPSHQALGGHRSSHKKIQKLKIMADEDQSASDDYEAPIPERMLEIDLNAPPAMEVEEFAGWSLVFP